MLKKLEKISGKYCGTYDVSVTKFGFIYFSQTFCRTNAVRYGDRLDILVDSDTGEMALQFNGGGNWTVSKNKSVGAAAALKAAGFDLLKAVGHYKAVPDRSSGLNLIYRLERV